jgi:hypothetical protein
MSRGDSNYELFTQRENEKGKARLLPCFFLAGGEFYQRGGGKVDTEWDEAIMRGSSYSKAWLAGLYYP